jgi:hypothetical protein
MRAYRRPETKKTAVIENHEFMSDDFVLLSMNATVIGIPCHRKAIQFILSIVLSVDIVNSMAHEEEKAKDNQIQATRMSKDGEPLPKLERKVKEDKELLKTYLRTAIDSKENCNLAGIFPVKMVRSINNTCVKAPGSIHIAMDDGLSQSSHKDVQLIKRAEFIQDAIGIERVKSLHMNHIFHSLQFGSPLT